MVTEANTQPPAIPITTPAIHALGPGRYCNCRNPSSCLCCTRNSRASLPTPPPSRPHPLLVTVIVLAAGMLRPRDGNLLLRGPFLLRGLPLLLLLLPVEARRMVESSVPGVRESFFRSFLFLLLWVSALVSARGLRRM